MICRRAFAVSSSLFFAGHATAADFSTPTAYDWTGFYLGAQAGYAWGDSPSEVYERSTGRAVEAKVDFAPEGALGGLYLGYQHQFSGGALLGVEADFAAGGIDNNFATLVPGNRSYKSEIDWQGAVRLKVGYAFDRFLPYVAGGLAFARYETSISYMPTPLISVSKTLLGGTVGAGVEYAFSDAFSARVEYRYAAYEEFTARHPDPTAGVRTDLETHDVRVGVGYRF